MIIVALIICIGLIVFGLWLINSTDFECTGIAIALMGTITFVISLITCIAFLIDVINLKVIDQKIDMYQQENANIESQIAECVTQYQKYETEIFTEINSENAMTLISLYPELKSDALVSKQIEVYIANNTKIKELKELKIDGEVSRWWLYFG